MASWPLPPSGIPCLAFFIASTVRMKELTFMVMSSVLAYITAT